MSTKCGIMHSCQGGSDLDGMSQGNGLPINPERLCPFEKGSLPSYQTRMEN